MDESTEKIYKLTDEIATLKKEIEETEAEKKKAEEALAEATRIRADEKAAWTASDKDDNDAHTTVQAAVDVLTQFYQENNLMLVQKKQPVIEAGKAPPPPPSNNFCNWGQLSAGNELRGTSCFGEGGCNCTAG